MGNYLTNGSAKDRGGEYVVATVRAPVRQGHAVGGDRVRAASG